MALQVGSRLGPYQVTAKIGEGGIGCLFKKVEAEILPDVLRA